MTTKTFEVRGMNQVLIPRLIEKELARVPGVPRVDASYASQSATVNYDEAIVEADAIAARIRDCGFHCAGESRPTHCEPLAPPAHVHANAEAAPSQADVSHAMGHGAGKDASAMASDMRIRFWVALAFTVPIFIYSPMGALFTPPAAPFGLRLDLWLFLLATAAIAYPAWPFLVGAFRSVRHGVFNMAVLVVLSVGTGYLFSVGSTFIYGGAQFYEAVSVLLVFILLGHWLEMRARAGASSAIRALLDRAPPKASVLRDGREVQVPTAEVRAGETRDRAPIWLVATSMVATAIATAITAAEHVHAVRHEACDQDHEHDREDRHDITVVARSHKGASCHERLQPACQTRIPPAFRSRGLHTCAMRGGLTRWLSS